MAIALRGHQELDRAKIRLRRSEGAVRSAESPFNWSLFGDAGYRRVEVPENVGDQLGDNTDTEFVANGAIGATKQFENGITVSPGFIISEGTGSDTNELLSDTRTRPLLNVTVPLLRVMDENPLAANLKAAKMSLAAADSMSWWERQKFVQEAVLAYWGALAARLRLEISTWVQFQAKTVAASIKQLVDSGELAPAVYQDTSANMLYRSLDIENATELFFTKRYELASSMGLSQYDADQPPVPVGQFPPVTLENPNEETPEQWYVDMALGRRPDLKALNTIERAEKLKLLGARNDLKPRVELVMELDRVFLRYVMDLGNSRAEGRVMEQTAAFGEARLNIDSLERLIATNVRQSLRRLRHGRRAYVAALEASRIIDAIAEDVNRRAAIGAASFQERLSAYERVGVARQRIVQAAYDYVVAIAQLRLLMSNIPVEGSATAEVIAQAFRTPPGPGR